MYIFTWGIGNKFMAQTSFDKHGATCAISRNVVSTLQYLTANFYVESRS